MLAYELLMLIISVICILSAHQRHMYIQIPNVSDPKPMSIPLQNSMCFVTIAIITYPKHSGLQCSFIIWMLVLRALVKLESHL